MRFNRLFIACCSSLILTGFAGCRKIVRINVDPNLAPIVAYTAPDRRLEWVATAPGQSFDVIFEAGLCTEKSPIHATYEHPAVCTVAKQKFTDKQPILYSYNLQGWKDGKPCPECRTPTFKVSVGPNIGPVICHHC